MAVESGGTEVWQARISRDLADQLQADSEVLGLSGRTEIVKAGLQLLHQGAAVEGMAGSVAAFYGEGEPPLPIGVVADESDDANAS